MNTLTYLAITVGCALFYLLSIVTGGEHDFHHSDFGDGHHGADSHQGHHDDGTSYKEFLSIRSLLLFGTGFGTAGAISSVLGFGPWLIPIFGIGSGSLFSWVGVKLFRFLRSQEATTSFSLFELEGLSGHLTVAISPGGVGEIRINDLQGESHFLLVRSEDGAGIPEGQYVQVVSASTGELVVRKTDLLPPVV